MAENLPWWLMVPLVLLTVLGGLLTLTGGVGLLRLSNFYQRTHGPSLPGTLGIGAILIASMLFFTLTGGRFVLHELLITIAVLLSAPITAMMLNRAAIERDRRQLHKDAPDTPGEPTKQIPTGSRIK